MSSGEVLKADKDFSKEVDVAIPEAEKLGAVCLTAYGADQS
jgi:26S proteasome regulatory subunit N5